MHSTGAGDTIIGDSGLQWTGASLTIEDANAHLRLDGARATITIGDDASNNLGTAYKIYANGGTTLKTGTDTNLTVATAWMYDAMSGMVMAIASTEVAVDGGIVTGYT